MEQTTEQIEPDANPAVSMAGLSQTCSPEAIIHAVGDFQVRAVHLERYVPSLELFLFRLVKSS